MKSILALILLLLSSSLQAQTTTCPNRVSVSTCNSRSHRVDSLVKAVDRTKERIAKNQSSHALALEKANTRYYESFQRAEARADDALARCSRNYDNSFFRLRCYEGLFYSDCDYKISNLKERYNFCTSNANEREAQEKVRVVDALARRKEKADGRFNRADANYQSKLTRDQSRLTEGKKLLDQCIACLYSQPSSSSSK